MVAAVKFGRELLEGRRNPFVAGEGIPFLLLTGAGFLAAVRYLEWTVALPLGLLFVALWLLFRDPRRIVPSAPLGVVSPVDGTVIKVDKVTAGVLQGEAHRIRLHIDSFGTYTARSPVEGKIMDLRTVAAEKEIDYQTNALWVQTDEGDDVVLQFFGYRLGLAPKAIVEFGERVGQGRRCAFLRLARSAEVHLPVSSTVLVGPGDVVVAGSDVIGKLLHS
jgi:phosphatidylserine decarboxylase